MDKHKQRIINSFRQSHLIANYDNMTPKQKLDLNKQIELLELDILDLVSKKA